MKQPASTFLTIGSILLILGLGLGWPGQLRSAQTQGGKDMMGSSMKQKCQEMMQQRQKTMEDIKAQDTQLSQMVAKLNGASRDQKVDQMASILTKMVEQRKATHERMETMQTRMMQHMMGHMQESKESMMQCPMMKGMSRSNESSEGSHQEHHSQQE